MLKQSKNEYIFIIIVINSIKQMRLKNSSLTVKRAHDQFQDYEGVQQTQEKKFLLPATAETMTVAIDKVKVDYKQKTFELMKKNTQLQIQLKQSRRDINSLQIEIQQLNLRFQDFIHGLDATELGAYSGRIRIDNYESNVVSLAVASTQDYSKCQQTYSDIIAEYQAIIKSQHAKHKQACSTLKCEQQENKQLRQQIDQHIKALKIKQQQIKTLQSKLVATQLRIDELQNQNESMYREKNELQEKYREEILHFEQMEELVEEKLIEVEYEMNFYKKERKQNLRNIEELRRKLSIKKANEKERSNAASDLEENYYSFGDNLKDIATQTDLFEQIALPENLSEEANSQKWKQQCYEESIKTLLNENMRLKSALLNLYQKQEGVQLSNETEMELKIMLSSLDLDSRDSDNEKKNSDE